MMLVLVLAPGCIQQVTVPPSPPTLDVKPTPLPSKVSTNTPASEIESTFTIRSFCPEISNDASLQSNLPGTLVLSGEKISLGGHDFSANGSAESVLLFWNGPSGKKITYQLPEPQEYYYYVTSPDKEKLAFTQGKTLSISYDVIILNNKGEESSKFTLPDDWNLFDWLNNETLLVRQNRLQKDKIELISINPVTREQQVLPANFPNMYSRQTLVVWGALTIFDPTAMLVLYPKVEGNEVASILWDVHNNKEIADITGLSTEPRWSPDAKRLLIVKDYSSTPTDVDHDEIVIIKPEGDAIRVTSFTANFDHSIINLPVWSSNGRYVAFWLSTSVPIETGKLAVLDTETSTVDLYCTEVDPFPYRMGEDITLGYTYDQVNSAPPIWSPDNRYLLIEDYQEFRSSTYLFDLQNHSITKVAGDARPIGWLK